MTALPTLSGRKVVKIFEKFGWEIARQKGSHIIMIREGHMATYRFPIVKK